MTLSEAVHTGFVRALANAEHLQVIRARRPVIQSAKNLLKQKGWSYRSAAPVLGTSWSFLSRVLNGHVNSAPLLQKIERLPAAHELEEKNESGE